MSGWDAFGKLTVTQCARMPMGMHTVEFIPNTLQEEWTYAWNVAHEIKRIATTEIDKDRELKWILWV